MSTIGVDEIPEDVLSVVACQVRALLDVLPEPAAASAPVVATAAAGPGTDLAPAGSMTRAPRGRTW